MARILCEAAAALAPIVLVVLSAATPASGQTVTDEGLWTTVSLRGRVSADPTWRWSADSFVQSRDGVRRLGLALEQVMVSRDMGQGIGIGFGYGAGAGFRESGALFEHRLTQMVTWSGGDHTRLTLRSLLEERFITGDTMLLRARQQVRVAWPLSTQRRLRAIVTEEVLVQADSRALASPRLDGNRLFAGVGWTLTQGSAVEIGYLNAYSSAGTNGRQSHVLSVSLAVSLTERKRQ